MLSYGTQPGRNKSIVHNAGKDMGDALTQTRSLRSASSHANPTNRFPNLKPGRQLANGNHFLALFPCPEAVASPDAAGVGVGGGGASSLRGSAAEASAIGVGGKKPGKFRRFLSSLLTCSCLSSRRAAREDDEPAAGDVTTIADPNSAHKGAAHSQGAMETGGGGVGGASGWQQGTPATDAGVGLGSETVSGARGGGRAYARRGWTARKAKKGDGVGWTRTR